MEFIGPAGSSTNAMRDSCALLRGTLGTGCARDDVSGACAIPREGSRIVLYGLSSDEVASAKEVCETSDGGVWSDS
jgi:hypothetical protein